MNLQKPVFGAPVPVLMADIYFVGKTNDYNQIAAVSMSGPLFSVLQAIGTLFGGGGMVALSTALGKEEESKIRKITSFCCNWFGIHCTAMVDRE